MPKVEGISVRDATLQAVESDSMSRPVKYFSAADFGS